MIVFETEMSVIEQSAIVNKNLLWLIYRALMNWHGVVSCISGEGSLNSNGNGYRINIIQQ
jgi:hypothetical protein